MKKPIAELNEEVSVFRLLYLLKSSGLTFPSALEIAANTFPTFRDPLLKILKGIREGYPLNRLFEQNKGSFTEFVAHLFWGVQDEYDQIQERLWDAAVILGRLNQLRKNGVPEERVNEVYFYLVLSALLVAGVPILTVLKIAGEPFLGPERTKSLISGISEGSSLFEILEKYQEHFTALDTNMVLAGEKTGGLPIICRRLAELKEQVLLLRFRAQHEFYPSDNATIENMLLYQQLGIFLESGFPVGRTLKFFAVHGTDGAKKKTFGIVTETVAKGESLADALTGVFPDYAVSLIEEGEKRGELETTFFRLVDYLRWELFDIEPTYKVLKLEEV